MQEPPDAAFAITIGSTSFDCRHGRFLTAINKPDTASGTVPADQIVHTPVDWADRASVAIGEDVLTTGAVVAAIPTSDGEVALSLRSALALSEALMPPMVVQNLRPAEIVYAAVRAAGFEASDVDIDGVADLRNEPVWVLAPVQGLHVDRIVRIGVVEFLDGDAGREMIRCFDPALDSQFSEPLSAVSAFARVAVVAQRLYDAEVEGLSTIDAATAWLTTRVRYSWSHDPDGHLQPYERAATRVIVERRDGVGVLAVDGPRRWWRATTVDRGAGEIKLGAAGRWTSPGMPSDIGSGDRQALLALQRAATIGDPVQRVTALWEAVEFYVGGRGPETQFAATEVRAIVNRACDGLSGAKRARVENVVRQSLNHFPIRARLEHVLTKESVPFTDDDLDRLSRLRTQRNRAVHGATAAPSHEDIDRALALMSRAITTRWHRGPEQLRT